MNRKRTVGPSGMHAVFRRRGAILPVVFSLIFTAPTLASDDAYEVRRATQECFRAVATRLRPSLVKIETVGGTQPLTAAPRRIATPIPLEDGSERAPRSQTPFRDTLGSKFVIAGGPVTGLVYSSDGYIITSSFNFVRDPALISVTLADGRHLVADLVARDHVRKLALLKVDADDLVVPEWVSHQDVRVGQWAIALGLGFGGRDASITVGIVSAWRRMQGNAIQTDAKLNPANYGGPLCDLSGRVIGIAVPMAQRPGELAGVEFYDAGIGFAVPRERVDAIAAELMTGRSFYRGWLGIVLDPRRKDAAIVTNIADPSPMQAVGVLPGDRIVRANGTEIDHFGHLVQALYMIPAGETVPLEIERDDERFTVQVTLARSVDLGSLPDLTEPFDPADPQPQTPEDSSEGDGG